MGKRKRKQIPETPYAIAVKPDLSLMSLGAYVKFSSTFRRAGEVVASKGDLGVVVKDHRSLCRKGQVAVKVPGSARYHPVPPKYLTKA